MAIVSWPAIEAVSVSPVNSTSPIPSAFNPKLPNDELEFVKSHWPPLPANIAISQPIVKIETNWA